MPHRMYLPKELEELASLLEDEHLPSRVPDSLVHAALRSKVIPVLASRSRAQEALGDVAVNEYLSQAAIGALRLREFGEIISALRDRGIDAIPLKGMAYGLMFERGGPVRAMADIDILVRPGDYRDAGEVMTTLGYREEFLDPLAEDPGHHERQFVKDGRLVEIHRYFLRGRRITVDYDALWDRNLPLDSDGLSCSRLSPEDTLLYHCFHMGMHEFALGGLLSVWELRRLLLLDNPDIATCARRARQWGTLRITWCAFRLLETCFPGTLSGSESFFTPSPPIKVLLDLLVVRPSLLLIANPGRLPRTTQIFRKALLVDRPTAAVSYLLWYMKFRPRSHPSPRE